MESLDFIKGWLQAFFDGEGCVTATKRSWTKVGGEKVLYWCGEIRACNSDYELIQRASDYLNFLGIFHNIHKSGNRKKGYKECWVISIARKESIDNFSTHVSFHTNRKRIKLEDFLSKIDVHDHARKAFQTPSLEGKIDSVATR